MTNSKVPPGGKKKSSSSRRNSISPPPPPTASSIQCKGKRRNSMSPPTSTPPSPKHQYASCAASPPKITSVSPAPPTVGGNMVQDVIVGVKASIMELIHDDMKKLRAEDSEKVPVKEPTGFDQTTDEQAMKMENSEKLAEANVEQIAEQKSPGEETVAGGVSKEIAGLEECRVGKLEKEEPLEMMKTGPSRAAEPDVLKETLMNGLGVSASFLPAAEYENLENPIDKVQVLDDVAESGQIKGKVLENEQSIQQISTLQGLSLTMEDKESNRSIEGDKGQTKLAQMRLTASFPELVQGTSSDSEDVSSYDIQFKSIMSKKLEADNDLATASESLKSVALRFNDLNVDLDHVVSKFACLTQYLDSATKERDDLKQQVEQLKTEAAEKSLVAHDLDPLRESIERIQNRIEELSGQFVKSFEENCHNVMLPIWHHVPETFKERYIRSVLSRRMFLGFENESFLVNEGALPVLDVQVLRIESMTKFHELNNKKAEDLKVEDGFFNQFSSERKTTIFKELRKSMLVGNLDLAKAMQESIEERLDELAKDVWAMHKLALSMEWRVRILRVQKGATFDGRWMEAVNSLGDEVHDLDGDGVKTVVEFMVMPGFQVGDHLISPCRVYLM